MGLVSFWQQILTKRWEPLQIVSVCKYRLIFRFFSSYNGRMTQFHPPKMEVLP